MPRRQGNRMTIACLLVAASLAWGQDPTTPHVDADGEVLPTGAIARLGSLRLRHYRGTAAIAWSPDGTLLATACPDVKVWDSQTGKEIERFKGKLKAKHAPYSGHQICHLAFSADGKVLRAGELEGSVLELDVTTGGLLRELRAKWGSAIEFGVCRATFSQDFKRVALAGIGDGAMVGDMDADKPVLRVDKQASPDEFALSPDGKYLLIRQGSKAHLWDLATGKECRVFPGGGVAASFSPDGRLLAISSWDAARVWEVAKGKEVLHLPGVAGKLAFTPDGKKVAACGLKSVRLWDVRTGREVCQLQRTRGRAWGRYGAPAFSLDGKKLALNEYGSGIGIWDAATGKPLLGVDGHRVDVSLLAFSPDGKSLASGGSSGEGTLLVWDLATKKIRLRFPGDLEALGCLAWSPDGKTLATGEAELMEGRWDPSCAEAKLTSSLRQASDGQVVRQLTGHLGGVFSVAFSPDGKTLLTAGGDARAALWDIASGKRLHWLRGREHHKSAAFAPYGKMVLITGHGPNLLLGPGDPIPWEQSLWHTATGNKALDVGTQQGDAARAISFSAWCPGGQTIVTLEREVPGGRTIALEREIPTQFNLNAPAFPTHDAICFWDSQTGQKLRSVPFAGRHWERSACRRMVRPWQWAGNPGPGRQSGSRRR